ncbi:MAG: hypothetical protein SOU84_05355 [Candidatus Faecimonas sp.]|nr:hypothetical protein [Mycoplasmatota bacterium]MDY2908561.1 hypothetical protein [Candidatus Faecimonas sp.]
MNKIDGYLRFYKHMELCYRAYKSSPLGREYDLVKEQEAQLIKNLSNTEDIDIYQAIYHYLVWNGYFSAENKFLGASKDIIELTSERAIAIACGNGCCRNFACHFKKLMNLIEEDSALILVGTKYKGKREVGTSIKGLQEEVDETRLEPPKGLMSLFFPNHVEVLDLKNSKIPKLLDPFNFGIHTVTEEQTLLIKRQMIDFGTGLLFDFEMNSEDRDNIINYGNNLEKEFSKRKLNALPLEQRTKIYQQAIDLCKENIELLEQYQTEMNPIYQHIKEEAKIYQRKGF